MKPDFFHIVLVGPEIPQNTGNIGRIAVCGKCDLHLVEPISFSFDDKHLKRAGMDYWHHVDCTIHKTWEELEKLMGNDPVYFFSTKAKKVFWDCPYERGSWLVFGSESHGLPQEYHLKYPDRFYTIPMPGEFNRSLNLANSVGIAVFEGLRRYRVIADNAPNVFAKAPHGSGGVIQ